MQDAEKMTTEERLGYIFVNPDPALGMEPRWSWIENCVLGDIRTMLRGIESYRYGPRQFPNGSRLGGGNFSVPILVTTALEFVSRLYTGAQALKSRKGYDATANTGLFIERYFDGASRRIPWLLWQAVRNGLHHNFMPKTLKWHGVRISSCFISNEWPSIVGRISNDRILFCYSAQDLLRALSDAIARYRERLSREGKLQISFINAWQALEAPEQIGHHDGRLEAERLVSHLPEGEGAGLFERGRFSCRIDDANPSQVLMLRLPPDGN